MRQSIYVTLHKSMPYRNKISILCNTNIQRVSLTATFAIKILWCFPGNGRSSVYFSMAIIRLWFMRMRGKYDMWIKRL